MCVSHEVCDDDVINMCMRYEVCDESSIYVCVSHEVGDGISCVLKIETRLSHSVITIWVGKLTLRRQLPNLLNISINKTFIYLSYDYFHVMVLCDNHSIILDLAHYRLLSIANSFGFTYIIMER